MRPATKTGLPNACFSLPAKGPRNEPIIPAFERSAETARAIDYCRRAGERRTADGAEIQIQHQMIRHAQGGCDLPSPLHLHCMALSVGHREEEEVATLLLGNSRRDGGIQPSAKTTARFPVGVTDHNPAYGVGYQAWSQNASLAWRGQSHNHD